MLGFGVGCVLGRVPVGYVDQVQRRPLASVAHGAPRAGSAWNVRGGLMLAGICGRVVGAAGIVGCCCCCCCW